MAKGKYKRKAVAKAQAGEEWEARILQMEIRHERQQIERLRGLLSRLPSSQELSEAASQRSELRSGLRRGEAHLRKGEKATSKLRKVREEIDHYNRSAEWLQARTAEMRRQQLRALDG